MLVEPETDGDGYIVRLNAAMLHESGTHSSDMLGRSHTGLSMDPDPHIAQILFHWLLQAERSSPNVGANKMH
jgi:hypothetical protein